MMSDNSFVEQQLAATVTNGVLSHSEEAYMVRTSDYLVIPNNTEMVGSKFNELC